MRPESETTLTNRHSNRPFVVSESSVQAFEFIGGRTRIRTLDPLIKSQLLYQLSYAPLRFGVAVPRDGLDTKPGEGSKGRIRSTPDINKIPPPSLLEAYAPLRQSRRHSATRARTRSGLPEPCSIFRGAAKITAPVAGS